MEELYGSCSVKNNYKNMYGDFCHDGLGIEMQHDLWFFLDLQNKEVIRTMDVDRST